MTHTEMTQIFERIEQNCKKVINSLNEIRYCKDNENK